MYFKDQHKTIIRYYEALTKSVCDKYNLTQMEYDILMFLNSNPQHNTAADIVKIRKSTKSHVSTSLKELEDKGLIEKQQSDSNKKHIEIFLSDKANDVINDGIEVQKNFAKTTLDGVSNDEIAIFKAVFDKICNNAELCLDKISK